jgi:V/A-type H+-transporting ATPase subunit E
MNGIDKITRRIDEDAQSGIDALLADAKAAAAQTAARYAAQAEQLSAGLAEQNARAAAERKEYLVSAAQMESRKAALAAKQELVDEAFRLALERLCSLPDDRCVGTLTALLLRAAPDGRGEVVFSAADRERVGAAAVAAANAALGEKGRLTLSGETRAIRGGFLLVCGNVEVNCTFETLVRLQKGKIAGEVARILFPGQ